MKIARMSGLLASGCKKQIQMNWETYRRRQLYRTPVAVFTVTMCALAILNLPADRVQRRLWTGQAIESRNLAQVRMIRESSAGVLLPNGWERDHVVGRHAGWPESIAVTSAPVAIQGVSTTHPQAQTAGASPLPMTTTQAKAPQLANIWLAGVRHNLGALSLIVGGALALTLFGQWLTYGLLPFLKQRWGSSHALVVTGLLICFTATTLGCHRIVAQGIISGRDIAQRGVLGYASQFSWLVAAVLPEPVTKPFLKLDSAMVESLRPDLLDWLTEQPTLTRVHLKDCMISRDQWHRLISNPSMNELCFERCHFEPRRPLNEAIQWQATQLRLIDCSGIENIATDLLHANSVQQCTLQGPPAQLQSLLGSLHHGGLTHLQLVLSTGPALQSEELAMAQEPGALHERLELDGFDQLQKLKLSNRLLSSDHPELLVSIRDCRQLNDLELCRSRWWNLELDQLPRLKTVAGDSSVVDRLGAHRHEFPTIRSLSLCQLPTLQELKLDATDLRHLAMEECRHLYRLVLREVSNAPRRGTRTDSVNAAPAVLSERLASLFADQPWLQQIRELNLGYKRLAGVDLAPVLRMEGLRRLDVSDSQIDCGQLITDQTHAGLQQLTFSADTIHSKQLNQILDQFPNLRTVHAYASLVDELVLEDRLELQSLAIGNLLNVKAVKIQNCPKLNSSFRLMEPLRSLVIREAPQLTGLVVDHPIPSNTVLEGLRNLNQVALSGTEINDTHVKELARCHQLEILKLAAPNVSREGLRSLSRLVNLKRLDLSGMAIDDEMVRGYLPVANLFELDLAGTDVTAASLPVLSQASNLQKLSLANTKVHAAELQMLCGLRFLYRLDVSGLKLQPYSLARLLHQVKLDQLVLSGDQLSEELVMLLMGRTGKQVMALSIANDESCLHDPESLVKLHRLAEAHPHLIIETSKGPLSSGKLADGESATEAQLVHGGNDNDVSSATASIH